MTTAHRHRSVICLTTVKLESFILCVEPRLGQCCDVRVSQSVCLSVCPSVRLGVEPFRDSWTGFGCQDSCGFVCRGASSLSRGRVCIVIGHSSCVSNMYIYIFFFVNIFVVFLLFPFFFFFFLSFLGLQSRFCTADYAYCSYTDQGYNHSLERWIVRLTASKLEPLIHCVLNLALAIVENNDISVI
jgi:hypothetical protein